MEYFSALWQHWVALMSGVVGVMIGLALRIGRLVSTRVSKWPDIPDILFVVVGLGCLGFAGYQAWSDKRQELIKLQERLQTPNLMVDNPGLLSGTMNGHPFIIVAGAIRNPTGPASGTFNWRMYARLHSGDVVNGKTHLASVKDLEIPVPHTKTTLKCAAADWWPTRTAQPIPTGGMESGWFMSTFDGADFSFFRQRQAIVVVEFDDIVSGHKHSFSVAMGQDQLPLGPLDIGPYR